MVNNLSFISILEIKVSSNDYNKIKQFVINSINSQTFCRIYTPNSEMLVIAQKDRNFKTVLNNSQINIPDGVGLVWAAKILKLNLTKRITGIDMMLDLCQTSVPEKWKVFLLGGRGNVSDLTKQKLETMYPEIEIIGTLEGDPASESDPETRKQILEQIGKQKIDLLFVAYGAPAQEKWIDRNINSLPIHAAMGVGGSFNYIVGKSRRPSAMVSKLGLEWLYRLITEPWRWKRQLRLVEFVWLILKEKLNLKGVNHA